jgi:uncharacterized protein YndB with AHSA1/START domain
MLRLILIFVLLAIVALLIYAATKPDTFRIARSTSIKAPPEKVFPLIADLHNFNIWNPFAKKDPNATGAYSGAESGVGSAYAWEGNKNVGKGSMTIAKLTPSIEVVYKLDFMSPMEAHNTAIFTLVPNGENTQVTWAMEGPSPYLSKVMCTIFSMDKMVGPDFEAGLASLKALAEK